MTNINKDYALLDNIATAVARRYAARYGVQSGDLYQEAWCAMLRARETWEAAKGPLSHYLRRAAYQHTQGFAIKSRAPVHGHHRVWTELLQSYSGAEVPDVPVENNTEQRLVDLEQAIQVAERLKALFEKCPNGHIAEEHLMHGTTLTALASKYGTSMFHIRQTIRRAKSLIRKDRLIKSSRA
jgi:DNA-directed RNA polymerase specialized sigma24 family protein